MFNDIPPVTRLYLAAIIGCTLGLKANYVQPLQLYFNPKLVFQGEYWRLISSFLFFGSFGIHFCFNLLFIYRYCKSLEEEHYRGKTAEFLVFFVFSAVLIIITGLVLNLPWLGMSFTQVFVYVWSRRNPYTLLNFLGFIVRAPFLPYAFMGFSYFLGGDPTDDLIGIIVGHIYYYLEDVFPNLEGGFKMLGTPEFLKRLLNEDYRPPGVENSNEENNNNDITDLLEPVNTVENENQETSNDANNGENNDNNDRPNDASDQNHGQ